MSNIQLPNVSNIADIITKIAFPSDKTKDKQPENQMINLLSGILDNLNIDNIIDTNNDTNNDTNTNSSNNLNEPNINIANMHTKNKNTPYQLINDFYGILWGKSDMNGLKHCFTDNASLSYRSNIDEANQWTITSNDKIIDYYQQIWVPYVKNTSTMIYKFNFSVDEEDNEAGIRCSVNYNIYQSQLDIRTMTWNKYNIEVNAIMTLVNEGGVYKILLCDNILLKHDILL
jgi:hypothetical protein